ncbi:MAG: TIGR01777 family protein [Elusimicrobia bacterium]|nr:TIGR01777 family protein [Elusimicrobiota bacterium]MBK7545719.1 TIGR01777 family protein [Elusimicrobiota bacterium]MBK7574983.1 TIGR01777 family protein [Elusimicrobiota bacterium]MBK8125328.1 TIGR01777 family protein [Elusimicrobiota bacterium]MBK8651730.1 TIGR01777 family protein [Elusimicrobiota bacterium]
MKLLISGSTGLIGEALTRAVQDQGHEVTRLSRGNAVTAPRVLWDPVTGQIPLRLLEGFDAVIHLAGESIAAGRWTAARKKRIRDSRVYGTSNLVKALTTLERPPRIFLSASAIGFYGDRGNDVLSEDSVAGEGFLPSVCREWEAAADPLRSAGLRVAHARFGIVLSRRGGALPKMLLPFRLGLGGAMGNGRQWWSWVALPDAVEALLHILHNDSLSGPVNVTAPGAVTNRAFTDTLGRVLRRPTVMPLPGFVARLLMGEMASGLLLASARVEPRRLAQSGFQFRFPDLATALKGNY